MITNKEIGSMASMYAIQSVSFSDIVYLVEKEKLGFYEQTCVLQSILTEAIKQATSWDSYVGKMRKEASEKAASLVGCEVSIHVENSEDSPIEKVFVNNSVGSTIVATTVEGMITLADISQVVDIIDMCDD